MLEILDQSTHKGTDSQKKKNDFCSLSALWDMAFLGWVNVCDVELNEDSLTHKVKPQSMFIYNEKQ